MQNNLKIIVIKVHLSALTSMTLIGTMIVNIVTQLLRDISKEISIVKLEKKIKATNFTLSVLQWESTP